ncbi:MAG TPA: glucose-1-phosphate cytidylyltransferase [Pirellulales bacterium]|jgi:glucose-1-phosphate cytidylyltransferase
MKVVLFCGGLGMRLREHAENIPKPLVNIDQRPILWNVMKYYAHWGHKEFILCLGWKGEAIKNYFLNYNECLSNDFVLSEGGKVNLLRSDIQDWRITFVDTGVDANVGQRLMAVRPYLEGDEVFLANYTDGLSDLPLPQMIQFFHDQKATAAFVAVRPQQSWHAVDMSVNGAVQDVQPISNCGMWMNGGFFVLQERIFDFMEEGDELVDEPFRRLMDRQELFSMKYDGFWSCMDTFKDKQRLEDMVVRGRTPWQVWREPVATAEDDLGDGLDAVEMLKPTQPQ